MLSEVEAKQVLAAYGIPIVETRVATTPQEAGRVAADIGFPVALKIISEDVVHKSDVGGVDLDLGTSEAVVASAVAMAERVRSQIPDVRISGYSVQRMARMKASHELIVGVSTDPVFGPVIVFGEGGKAVDVVKDSAIALPPLNDVLARELIRSTRIARVLEGYRDMPPIDEQALIRVLIQVSALVADNPHIVELDINPLLASPAGSLALDARIKVSREARAERLAIRPYPHDLEEAFVLRNGRETLLRPIRPEDEPKHHELHSRLTPEDIRFRHFGMVKSLPHSQMARYTQIDYDREMAFLATSPTDDGDNETLGVARAVSDPNFDTAEFAVIIRSDLKGQGLGHALLDKLVRYWRERGLRRIVGRVSAENQAMLGLATKLGFTSRRLPDDDTVEIVKDLAGPPNKA
jgi:acetyltransferase